MLLGYKAKNHPQQVSRRGALDSVDDRETAPDLFLYAESKYGPFSIDVAAGSENTKCSRYYTKEDDGLSQSWKGENVWCNPPFSSIQEWVRKAWQEWPSAKSITMLLPANRTEQNWWYELVEPFRDRPGSNLSVEFLKGRPRFIYPGTGRVLPNQRPPFGCCFLAWQIIAPNLNEASDQAALNFELKIHETL